MCRFIAIYFNFPSSCPEKNVVNRVLQYVSHSLLTFTSAQFAMSSENIAVVTLTLVSITSVYSNISKYNIDSNTLLSSIPANIF